MEMNMTSSENSKPPSTGPAISSKSPTASTRKSQPGEFPKPLTDAITRSLAKGADEARKNGRMKAEQTVIESLNKN